jgi:hypothetical protein
MPFDPPKGKLHPPKGKRPYSCGTDVYRTRNRAMGPGVAVVLRTRPAVRCLSFPDLAGGSGDLVQSRQHFSVGETVAHGSYGCQYLPPERNGS